MGPELDAALAAAVVGMVLGSLGTYVFDLRKEQRARVDRDRVNAENDKRHRAAIATALIQDLRSLESLFRQFYDAPTPSRAAVTRPKLYFDTLMGETRHFSADSITPLAEFHRRVDHYFMTTDVLRSMHGGKIESSARLEYELRGSAAFVLQALPSALKALESEGGIVSKEPPWQIEVYPTLPPVPDPIFAQTSARVKRDKNAVE